MGSVGRSSGETSTGSFGGLSPDVFEGDSDSFDVNALRREMHQTGYEAGDPDAFSRDKLYVNTGKSFCINKYLMTDGESYMSEKTDWGDIIRRSMGGERWIKNAISELDSGMAPLTQDIRVSRFLEANALKEMTGIDVNDKTINKFLVDVENGGPMSKGLTRALGDADYTQKAYTSTTYAKTHGSYGENPIKLNIVARKGTPAIITKNDAESEILLGRGLTYNFTKKFRVTTLPSGKKQLVIDMYL